MQELIEYLEINDRKFTYTYKKANELLEKEKEQIIEAYWGGLNGKLNVYSESDKEFIYGKGAEIYYENLIKK